MESTHVWAGVPRWLLGDPADACKMWEIGLECQYRDMAGGMHSPVLLYFASLRHPDAFDPKKALSLIGKRAASPKVIHWPGPIGSLLLGEMTEQQLNHEASQMPYEPSRKGRFGMVHFYAGVLALAEGKRSTYLERMRKCIEIRESKLNPEGFLAHHELNVTSVLRKPGSE